MISVAAELAEMHPQTLRMYEARGLIEPKRSPKGTRLYSQADVERLRRIQEMTTELGLNLAGVERVLELEEQLERASRRLEALERRSAEMRAEMEAEIERVRKSFKAELVPYKGTPPTSSAPTTSARGGARSASSATRSSRPPRVGGARCATASPRGSGPGRRDRSRSSSAEALPRRMQLHSLDVRPRAGSEPARPRTGPGRRRRPSPRAGDPSPGPGTPSPR